MFAIVMRTPKQNFLVTVIRACHIPNKKSAAGAQLTKFPGEITAHGLFALSVTPDFVKRAVAESRVNGIGLKDTIKKVAMKKVNVSATEFAGSLAFVKPSRKLR